MNIPVSGCLAYIKRMTKRQIGAILKFDVNTLIWKIRRQQVVFNNVFGRAAQPF
jgi:hypothetical protein